MPALHNGSHAEQDGDYFEWWYFQFVAKDIVLNVVVHETDLLGLQRQRYISMGVRLGGEPPLYFRTTLEAATISRDSLLWLECDGRCKISERHESLDLSVAFSPSVWLECHIAKTHQPIAISDGVLVSDAPRNLVCYWYLPIAYGRFIGRLHLGSDSIDLSGVSYHDHQWGNGPLSSFVSEWFWCSLANEAGEALICFRTRTRFGTTVDRCVYVANDSVHSTDSLNATFLEEVDRHPKIHDITVAVTPGAEGLPAVVHFPLPQGHVLRQRDELQAGIRLRYTRWAPIKSSGSGLIRDLSGIAEHLQIREEGDESATERIMRK